MSRGWIDVSNYTLNSLLLLEKFQIQWLLEEHNDSFLSHVFQKFPYVAWYFIHKCPEHEQMIRSIIDSDVVQLNEIEFAIEQNKFLSSIEDWLVYAHAPEIYDNQDFLKWNDQELLSITNFRVDRVIDVGSGTGRLAFTIAPFAKEVYAVEPVGNLRDYIRKKAISSDINNIHVIDGLLAEIPFPDRYFNITVCGHVFGDDPSCEYNELQRVTCNKGYIILCPGNIDEDNDIHLFLLQAGFSFSRFEEPKDGIKRKYWKQVME